MAKQTISEASSAIGSQASVEVYDQVKAWLIPTVGPDKAKQYALFSQQVYDYVQNDPDVQAAIKSYRRGKEGKDLVASADKIADGARYANKARELELAKSAAKFRNYGLTGMGGILKIFVDHFEVFARQHGLELNDCALQVTKVCLSIAAAGAEALTVWGLLLASFDVLSTFKDAYGLGKSCFTSQ